MAYYLYTIAQSQREGAGTLKRRRFGPGLAVITWLYIVWSLAPVLIAVRISFNSGRSRSTFQSPSFRWYWDDHGFGLAGRRAPQTALGNTLKLAGADDADRRAVGGGDGDRAAALARQRPSRAANNLMLLPLVTPEIVLGVALFLVFTEVYTSVPRGFTHAVARSRHVHVCRSS